MSKFYLILPDIRSCHNIGAFFRTADAFGVDKIFLTGYTACPPKPQIDKVSLGAEKWVKWEKRVDLKRLIVSLKKKGVFVVGLEKTDESVDIKDIGDRRYKIEGRDMALVVGNEVDGVASEILELCDVVVNIPMYGKKESLNVSIAGGIALYEISRKIRQ